MKKLLIGLLLLILVGCSDANEMEEIDEPMPIVDGEILYDTDCLLVTLKDDGVYVVEDLDPRIDRKSFEVLGPATFRDEDSFYVIFTSKACHASILEYPLDKVIFNQPVPEGSRFFRSEVDDYFFNGYRLYSHNIISAGESPVVEIESEIEDLSKLPNFNEFQIDGHTIIGIKLVGGYENKLLFQGRLGTGGTFYLPVWSLDLDNLEAGFVEVEDFVLINNHHSHPSYQKYYFNHFLQNRIFMGFDGKDKDTLLMIDIAKDFKAEPIFTAKSGETFFTPGIFGDDDLEFGFSYYEDEGKVKLPIYKKKTSKFVRYEEVKVKYKPW